MRRRLGFVVGLVTLPYAFAHSAIVNLRIRRMVTAWDDADHVVEMEPRPSGCPGQAIVAPGPILWKQRRVLGAQHAVCALVDRHRSSLTVLALERIEGTEELDQRAREIDDYWAKRGHATYTPVTVEQIGGSRALRQRWVFDGFQLTEWRFAHRGWFFVVGVVNRGPDEEATLRAARRALDSWQWRYAR